MAGPGGTRRRLAGERETGTERAAPCRGRAAGSPAGPSPAHVARGGRDAMKGVKLVIVMVIVIVTVTVIVIVIMIIATIIVIIVSP